MLLLLLLLLLLMRSLAQVIFGQIVLKRKWGLSRLLLWRRQRCLLELVVKLLKLLLDRL